MARTTTKPKAPAKKSEASKTPVNFVATPRRSSLQNRRGKSMLAPTHTLDKPGAALLAAAKRTRKQPKNPKTYSISDLVAGIAVSALFVSYVWVLGWVG